MTTDIVPRPIDYTSHATLATPLKEILLLTSQQFDEVLKTPTTHLFISKVRSFLSENDPSLDEARTSNYVDPLAELTPTELYGFLCTAATLRSLHDPSSPSWNFLPKEFRPPMLPHSLTSISQVDVPTSPVATLPTKPEPVLSYEALNDLLSDIREFTSCKYTGDFETWFSHTVSCLQRECILTTGKLDPVTCAPMVVLHPRIPTAYQGRVANALCNAFFDPPSYCTDKMEVDRFERWSRAVCCIPFMTVAGLFDAIHIEISNC